MIRDDRWREKAGQLETAVAVRRAHHGNLDALIGKSGDASCPFSFDRGPPLELKAEFLKEINRQFEVVDDDSYVIQPFERHASNLQDVPWMQQRTLCNQVDHGQSGSDRRDQYRETLFRHLAVMSACRQVPVG